MKLLSKLKPAGKRRKRIGRGGSRGGQSGAGHKGQKARSGSGKKAGFEGGQMPLTRRMPKRGFSNKRFATQYAIVNIGLLNDLFDDGAVVARQAFVEKGILSRKNALPLKVLGDGEMTKKLTVYSDAWSQSAERSIRARGGALHKPGEES